MKIIVSSEEMQQTAASMRRAGKRMGFVPTMGFLHEGHLSLVDLARREADVVVLSIFVNAAQFGSDEDFARYPRNFERDAELCEARGVDIIFHPDEAAVYAPGRSVYVDENRISGKLCGASRPGHFRGVLTVVAKLFNIIGPDLAVFGQKDAQQAKLIKLMARDLDFPVRILTAPIVREPDGLAMSSRNTYLSGMEREDALCLVRALKAAKALYDHGERDADVVIRRVEELMGPVPSARMDYAEIVDSRTFERVERMEGEVVVLLAVRIGETRLIDNLTLPDSRLSNLPA